MSQNPIVFGKRENASLMTSKRLLIKKPTQFSGAERRESPRRKMLKACKIVFNNRQSVLDAVMVNLSEKGAKIRVNDPSHITKEFELTTVFGNNHFFCAIKWHNHEYVGVEFVT